MSVHSTIYDVFLSYPLTEKPVAELIERGLQGAGLDVFNPARMETGSSVQDVLWRALAESAAFVVVIPREGVTSSSTAVELGAAMAWHKPIFVISSGNGNARLPAYLSGYQVYPLSRIEDVAQSIQQSLHTLSEEEVSLLHEVYHKCGIPTDKLLFEPASLDKFARTFNARSKVSQSGERLVQELLRLRKAGLLPRLNKA
jgi:hypothetical protein